MIGLALVAAALAAITAGGAGLARWLGPSLGTVRFDNAGWCFLLGSAVAALALHLPLAIDGTIARNTLVVVIGSGLLLGVWKGVAHVRATGVARFFGLEFLHRLSLAPRLLAIALILMVATVGATSLSGWDERAIYALKGRILYFEGSVRTEGFSESGTAHFQPRYPLLVPLLEASLFAAKGSQDDRGLKLLVVAFGLALAMIVTEEAIRRVGSRHGALWGLFFLATPFVLSPAEGKGMTGYADLPFTAYATAALVLVGRSFETQSERAARIAGGFFLGAAMLTKQEGAIWALVVALALVATSMRWPSRSMAARARSLAETVIPAIAMWVTSVAARRWIPDSAWRGQYASVLDLDWLARLSMRPFEIAPEIGFQLAYWRDWSLGWPLLVIALTVLRRPQLTATPFFWRTVAGAVSAAYLLIFIVTPYQVHWHIATAFSRLLLHLHPVAVLILAEQVSASRWWAQGTASDGGDDAVPAGAAGEKRTS